MNKTAYRLFAIVFGSWNIACAQTILNMSQDLVRLRIASTNMVANQPGQDAAPLFVKAMNYAKANQIGKVVADPGLYYFQTVTGGCYAPVPSGIALDFQGSDLYFADPDAGAVCTNGVNITLQNFTVDYLQLPYTQITVTATDPARQQISFTVQPGWQNPSTLNAIGYNPYLTIYRGNRVLISLLSVQAPFADNQATILSTGPGGIDYHSLVAQIRPGDAGVLAKSANVAISGVCSGCTFRNIRVYTAGTGATYLLGQSNIFERFYVMPRPGTDRLRSTGNDGIHFGQTGPNSIIRLCRVIRNGDDGFSPISAKFGIVTKQLDSRTLQVQGTPGGYEDGIVSYYALNPSTPPLPNGSSVQFERKQDGAVLGSAVIVSQTAPQPITGTAPNGNSGPTNQLSLTFDRDLSSDFVGATVYSTDPNRRGGNMLLERNTVQQQVSGSGFNLYGLVNATVKGNYTSRSAWTGVWIDSNTYDPYSDAPPSSGVTVSNNVIDRPNNWLTPIIDDAQFAGIQALAWRQDTRPMQVSPMQNLTISDNFVADPRRSGIWMGNATGGSVSGNYLLNPNHDPQPQASSQPFGSQFGSDPLVLDTSQNVATGNNTIDQTSGRMWVTDAQFRELAAYAPGSAIRLNAFNVGKLPNPTLTITDADGLVTALKIQATADHFLDVQLPAAASLGGAYVTMISAGTKYFGTLFLDSQDNIPALNGCTYEVSPSSTSAPAAASTLPLLVVTQAGCSYQALDTDAFVTLPASSSGTGVISVGLAANSASPRTTTIEIAGEHITLSQAAPTPSIQAIVDSWDYMPGVSPGAWVTITGSNLATGAPQTWSLNGTQQLPTTLSGATVTFNGTPAALYYTSPTQINALVPALVAPGPVQVVVQSNGILSNPFTIAATATLPSIYALPTSDGSSFFVTAALAGTGTLIGNSAVDPRVTRAALPGDVLDLYMIGLGATIDASKFITDQVFSGAYPVSAAVTATVGGEPAQVLFAGLTSPGLYLVRVVLPSDIAAGPQAIQVAAGGAQTRASMMIMVGNR